MIISFDNIYCVKLPLNQKFYSGVVVIPTMDLTKREFRAILSFYDNGQIKQFLTVNEQNYVLLTNGDFFAWAERIDKPNNYSYKIKESVNGYELQNFPRLLVSDIQSISEGVYSLNIRCNNGNLYS